MHRFRSIVYAAFLVLGFGVMPALAADVAVPAHTAVSAPAPARHALPADVLKFLGGGAAIGSLANMKDPGTLSKKFVTRASAAAPDYQSGVQNAGSTWESHTTASEPAYEQGVQQAIANKRFAQGAQGKAAKFQQNAATLGAQRYPQGVQNAGDAWARGVAPAFNTLKSLSLPPRGARRSPQNQQRSAAVQIALGALKSGH